MSNYRRAYAPGGTFFFTLVTYDRAEIFRNDQARQYLRESLEGQQAQRPFDMLAMVLLPEHLHCIWKLPDGDNEFSVRWACIKKSFTQLWLKSGGKEGKVSPARKKLRSKGIWQRRFWEHTIKDEDDFYNHMNYIHYNPVRHKLVGCPHQWPYSSFHRWAREGFYTKDWLCVCNSHKIDPPNFDDIEHTIGE